ncbi:MAG: hypothetical protein CL609_03380 [Anaerolineaceae bacterium]|nr:hypothetical protein [Anaerolineaceae bacterium]
MKKEVFARILIVLFIGMVILIFVLGWQKNRNQQTNTIQIHARMPENGGWSITSIAAETNQPINLRLTSDDVVHGFAVGKSDQPTVELIPGEFVETTLLFDEPGTYTYYCTRWCGPNHWRMRGTIEVQGEMAAATNPPPLYLQLGIDIDAPHEAKVTPREPVSPQKGASFAEDLPAYVFEQETYLANSPASVWSRLRAEPDLSALNDGDIWNVVGWIWRENTSPTAIKSGESLYAENCAACHGETGEGDGVMVRDLPIPEAEAHDMYDSHSESSTAGLTRPHDLTDPDHLLGASPALLAGKIIRGGMGTGMPYWGPIFTSQQIDALVSYLHTFVW